MEKQDNISSRGSWLKFLLVLVAVTIVLSVSGLYFFHRLTQNPENFKSLNFTVPETGKPPLVRPPVSEDAARIFYTVYGRRLGAESFPLSAELTTYEKIDALINQLIKGPSSKYFSPVISENTKLRGIYIMDDEASLDFSEEISSELTGGSLREMLSIYSIVNTVSLNLEEISKVRILVDGKPRKTLAGNIDITAPLNPNINIVQW